MKKKCKIIMLPNDTGRVCRNNIKQKLFGNSIGLKAELRMGDCTNQHLYIISDDEIKEGDWMLDTIQSENPLELATKESIYFLNTPEQGWKKIIASTDNSLNFPNIPEEFIKLYIEKYNSRNPIEEVEVKYILQHDLRTRDLEKEFEHIPIIDSNNCISIQSIKDSYTREEVIQLLKKYDEEFVTTKKLSSLCFDKWIEENF